MLSCENCAYLDKSRKLESEIPGRRQWRYGCRSNTWIIDPIDDDKQLKWQGCVKHSSIDEVRNEQDNTAL